MKRGRGGDYRYQGLARPLQSITILVHAPIRLREHPMI